MNTNILCLAPHRDAVSALERNRRALFAAGFAGAFSFPPVIPIAVLSAPLDGAEIKSAAAALRTALGGAKITGGSWSEAALPCSDGLRLYGPRYTLPELAALPLKAAVFPAIFPAALLAPGEEAPPSALPACANPGLLDFRAAALTNLVLHRASCGEAPYSLRWRTGALFWLPRPEKTTVKMKTELSGNHAGEAGEVSGQLSIKRDLAVRPVDKTAATSRVVV